VLIETKTSGAAPPRAVGCGEHLVAIAKSHASCDSKHADSCDKSRGSSVNKSFIKSIEFYENSRRIRFECAQKPEQPLQPCLLACVMRRNQTAARRRFENGAGW
jgi:hypothetical protein